MDTRIPRDLEGHPFYKKLTKTLGGKMQAGFVTFRLWCELGYQVEIHGNSGLLDFHEVPSFCASIIESLGPEWTEEKIMAALTECRLLEKHGDHYLCSVFGRTNFDLDRKLTEKRRNAHFNMITAAVERRSKKTIPLIDGELWIKGDGTRYIREEMNEIVLLIKSIDRLMHFPDRQPKGFDKAMITDAYAITTNTPKAKLNLILKRLYRFRSLPGVPRTTPLILKGWGDVLMAIEPEEGWNGLARKESYVAG